jgi:hypothetical protein
MVGQVRHQGYGPQLNSVQAHLQGSAPFRAYHVSVCATDGAARAGPCRPAEDKRVDHCHSAVPQVPLSSRSWPAQTKGDRENK